MPELDPYEEDEMWECEWECTYCGGEGTCEEGSDPLLTCPDDPHPCHACGGSGDRKDQTIF